MKFIAIECPCPRRIHGPGRRRRGPSSPSLPVLKGRPQTVQLIDRVLAHACVLVDVCPMNSLVFGYPILICIGVGFIIHN